MPENDRTEHASTEALGVTRVTYETGSEYIPTSNKGRIVIAFDGEAGIVTLVNVTRSGRRAWRAALPSAMWRHLLETMLRCGFPTQPSLEPLVPGEATTTLSWQRGSVDETVVLRKMPRYRDANIFMWGVVAHMAPSIAPDVPVGWVTPETRPENVEEVGDVS